MADNCELCQVEPGQSHKPFCVPCDARLEAKQHPVICSGCQTTACPSAVTWVAREDMLDNGATCADFEKKHDGMIIYTVESCDRCAN